MYTNNFMYFLKVYEVRSFSRAADHLYMTPQGVSKAIVKLESELGQSLFYRTPKGLMPTAFAHLLQPRAVRIIAELSALDAEFKALAGTFEEDIRIGTTLGAYQSLGLDFGDHLAKRLPDVSFYFEDSWDLQCEKSVFSGDFDLAFTSGPVDGTRFRSVKLRTSPVCALVSPSHPLAEKDVIAVADLQEYPLLLTGNLFKTHQSIVELCLQRGFTPNLHSATVFSETLWEKSVVENLVGITVATFLQDKYPRAYQVIPFDLAEISWELVLISRVQKHVPEVLEAIWQEIVDLASC